VQPQLFRCRLHPAYLCRLPLAAVAAGVLLPPYPCLPDSTLLPPSSMQWALPLSALEDSGYLRAPDAPAWDRLESCLIVAGGYAMWVPRRRSAACLLELLAAAPQRPWCLDL
jgi:hypothetical protein